MACVVDGQTWNFVRNRARAILEPLMDKLNRPFNDSLTTAQCFKRQQKCKDLLKSTDVPLSDANMTKSTASPEQPDIGRRNQPKIAHGTTSNATASSATQNTWMNKPTSTVQALQTLQPPMQLWKTNWRPFLHTMPPCRLSQLK